jgi:hypothetical protein
MRRGIDNFGKDVRMASEIAELAERLKSNPVYCLSLGSRELFHSNFLGWMFEKYPHTLSILTGPVAPDWIKVERERKNLDLLITYGQADECHAVVVEIKVKDTPPLCQGSCPLLYFSSISQVGGIGR